MHTLTDDEITIIIREGHRSIRPHVCSDYDCPGTIECTRCEAVTPDCQREGDVCRDCAAEAQRAALRSAQPSQRPALGDYAVILPGVWLPRGVR